MSKKITLVTVTYGSRLNYVTQLLDRTLNDEVFNFAVLVNNGGKCNLAGLTEKWSDRLAIVQLDQNYGTALAYKKGIEQAIRQGATRLFLCDDDNVPDEGAPKALSNALDRLITSAGPDRAMVVGFRPDHQKGIEEGLGIESYPPISSFLGFHFRQLPTKLLKRLKKSPIFKLEEGFELEVPYAPYGGLMAEQEAFVRNGSPKEDLILYADDTEYTLRFAARGGTIKLITDARLHDLETSWNIGKPGLNAFQTYLREGSDFRSYYSLRNRAWIDRHLRCGSSVEYFLNRFIFLLLLRVYCRSSDRNRLKVIRQAISDGEHSALGMSTEFPMLQSK